MITAAWLTTVSVYTHGWAILNSCTQHSDIALTINSGVMMHSVADVKLLGSCHEDAPNLTFITAAGIDMTSKAVCILFVMDDLGIFGVVEMSNAYFDPNQLHNLILVSKITRHFNCPWGSQTFRNCARADNKENIHQLPLGTVISHGNLVVQQLMES